MCNLVIILHMWETTLTYLSIYRRGIHRHKKSPLHTSSLMSDSSSGLETNDIVTDVITTPIISCDTLTSGNNHVVSTLYIHSHIHTQRYLMNLCFIV